MLETAFDAAVDAILDGSARPPVQRCVDVATHISRAPIAFLVARRGDTEMVLASLGIPHIPFGEPRPYAPSTSFLYEGAAVFDDLTQDTRLSSHPLVQRPGGWRWLAVIPLPLPSLTYRVALVCADPRVGLERGSRQLERLQNLAAMAADELQMIAQIATMAGSLLPSPPPMVLREVDALGPPHVEPPIGERAGVTAAFLLGTLIEHPRLLHRGDIAYHGVMRWRSAVKRWQVLALRALKQDAPHAFVEAIARQLADAAHSLFGRTAFASVVAVPCGHSGPDCLSRQIACAVATLLGRQSQDAFEPLPVQGSSHPRRNAGRPAMKLVATPDQPVLLIDDVASSGAHIEEATRLLRAAGVVVFPLVWIAA